MALTQQQKIGWAQALFSVLVLWGLNNIMRTFSAQVLDANGMVFVTLSFISSALILLLIGGPGKLSKETMRSINTWSYGIILFVTNVISFVTFSYVTATEATLMHRITVLFGLFSGWFFLSRPPNKGQLLGVALISSAVFLVGAHIPNEIRHIVYLSVTFFALAQTIRVLMAELHKPYAKASEDKDLKSRCRVMGFVMFTISLIFLTATFLLALLQESTATQIFPQVPTLADFAHGPTILAAMVTGMLLTAPIRFLEFSSTQIIKSENFLAITALSSISTLFWEWFTSPLTGLSLKLFSGLDLFALVLVTAGGAVMAIAKMRHKQRRPEELKSYLTGTGQDLDLISDSREILANALEHYDGDTKKAAAALDVPVGVVNAMLTDKDKILAFRTSVLKKVARNYRHNIATSDSLTGLTNRAGFMTELKEEINKGQELSILYIDLNKFKPINDTYGHQAGDEALRITAERMISNCKANSTVARLGGDEFAIMLLDTNKDQVKEIQIKMLKAMEEDIKLEDGTVVNLSASFGSVTYPEDGTDAEELLELADKAMYQVKQGR